MSRCGMIYMEPQSLGWRPIFTSWLHTLPKTFSDLHKTVLTDMFDRFVDACLQMVRRKLKVRVIDMLMSFLEIVITNKFSQQALFVSLYNCFNQLSSYNTCFCLT